MVVLDMSWSMAESGFQEFGRPKIGIARDALATVMEEAQDFRRIGFATYGPGGTDECNGVKVHFAPIDQAADLTMSTAMGMNPLGSTPLTAAVELAAVTLGEQGTVVLITDGAETCQGNPCALAADLAAQGGVTVHVIGFQVKGAFREWQSVDPNDFFVDEAPVMRCLADETGGEYAGATDLDELIAALRVTLGCPLFS